MRRMKGGRRGFTLIEIAMVLAVIGLMVGFLMEVKHSSTADPDCYLTTKTQLNYLRRQVEIFAHTHERLPMPAKRYVGPENISYGREASGTEVTQAAGVSFGALPFQTLGLSPAYAGDCWGNKYTYAVTTTLTSSAINGGYGDNISQGNITLQGDGGNTINSSIAYAIISHGEDGLGAVKLGYDDSASGTPDSRWCTGSATAAYTNCLANAALLREGTFNNGQNAGNNYFDDMIVAAGKPKILVDYYAFGWGQQNAIYGELGDGYATTNSYPLVAPANGITFSKVATSAHHACGITSAGVAYCWGDNTYGEVGNGSSIPIFNTPTAVSGGLTFSDIAVSSYTSCGLTTGKVAYCWGNNTTGQIGDGSTLPRNTPTAVSSGGVLFKGIALGNGHACGLTMLGAIRCWGANNLGQLGDGTGSTSYTPAAAVSNGPYIAVTAGLAHSCGLKNTGSTYCWGTNGNGELGDGSGSAQSLSPVLVPGSSFSAVTSSSTSSTTCGLTATGVAYCWGLNTSGQIGDGSNTTRKTPVSVRTGETFSSIMPAATVTCALSSGNGKTRCWGDQAYGAFGNGSSSGNVYAPTPSAGGITFASLSVGDGTGCGLDSSGKLWCWGNNSDCNFGNDTCHSHTAPFAIKSLQNFSEVAAGVFHACGVTAAGAAYCWGYNTHGEVGDGSNTHKSAPTLVAGNLSLSTITAGRFHSCALTTSGAAYCWGQDNYGQLGNGSSSGSYNSPVAVSSGGIYFSRISAGANHTCALTSDGTAYCWGYNSMGQLGDGGTADSSTPVAVSGGLHFSTIDSGFTHTCGIATDGNTYCWGSNTYGQLGNNSNSASSVPVIVDGSHSFSSIASGNDFTCGTTSSGNAYCWGHNDNGQLGDASNADHNVPTAVSGGVLFNSISTSLISNITCGISTDAKGYCWGNVSSYQLGDGTGTTAATNAPGNSVLNSGSSYFKLKRMAIGSGFVLTLTDKVSGCALPNQLGSVPHSWIAPMYQSSAPSDSCTTELRTCTSGTLSGSYTNYSCTAGCGVQTFAWNGSSVGCQAATSAMVSGDTAPITNTKAGLAGSGTLTCTNGILSISSSSCN